MSPSEWIREQIECQMCSFVVIKSSCQFFLGYFLAWSLNVSPLCLDVVRIWMEFKCNLNSFKIGCNYSAAKRENFLNKNYWLLFSWSKVFKSSKKIEKLKLHSKRGNTVWSIFKPRRMATLHFASNYETKREQKIRNEIQLTHCSYIYVHTDPGTRRDKRRVI